MDVENIVILFFEKGVNFEKLVICEKFNYVFCSIYFVFKFNYIKFFFVLLKRNVDLDVKISVELSVLYYVVYVGYFSICLDLINYGVNVNSRDFYFRIFLYRVVENG